MKKILLIDDERDVCYFLKWHLEETGNYKVFSCSDSAKAVSETEAVQPDLILLDLRMPGLSGEEIAEQLSVNPKTCEIPVIFLTATSEEERLIKGDGAKKARGSITKPIAVEELVRVIASVL